MILPTEQANLSSLWADWFNRKFAGLLQLSIFNRVNKCQSTLPNNFNKVPRVG